MNIRWKTTTLGKALQEGLVRQGLDRRIREEEVLQRWPDIVSTAIANHAHPVRMRRGILWIEVTDAVWRQELHMMRTGLIEKINAFLGEHIVEEIRLR
ncbi:MAG: DUF721 domain-containing protein [Bacteroidetes bacterium]|nr:DUF721 domain-containing protein [Bacteroidota bacterium]